MNAMAFPSGDHNSLSAPVESEVTLVASPPSRFIQNTCGLFSTRAERKASFLPSGDQRGRVSVPPRVNWRASPPELATIQMLRTLRFASRSGVDTEEAIHFPCGETCGSLTRCIEIKS